MRRVLLLVAVALTAVVLPACANKDKESKQLAAAIRATQHLPGRFLYSLTTPDSAMSVQGFTEDDFRFKARVATGGSATFDEVVADDTLAVRFLDPSRLPEFVDQANPSAAQAPTDFNGVTVADALAAQRWVLDANGAPSVVAAVGADVVASTNPVLQAVTVLNYVTKAAGEGAFVKVFNPDSINPTYTSSEDTFPKPAKGSGVLRYDIGRPLLPPISAVGAGGKAGFPQTKHFRRMAVYVKNGRVIDVREDIDLRGKQLDDFIRYERALLKEAKLPASVRSQYETLVKKTPAAQMGNELLKFLNVGLQQAGLPPVAIRSMSLEYQNLGVAQEVTIPDQGVVHGRLSVLTLSSRGKPAQATTSAGAGEDTTTVPVGGGDTTATSTP